jgi:hypothetical protein
MAFGGEALHSRRCAGAPLQSGNAHFVGLQRQK